MLEPMVLSDTAKIVMLSSFFLVPLAGMVGGMIGIAVGSLWNRLTERNKKGQ